MNEKSFKTLDELIDLLISRGVSIDTPSDRDYAKRILEKNGYYNLINGYNKLFTIKDTNGNFISYKPGTTMNEINALYEFDKSRRCEIFSVNSDLL